MDTLNSPLVLAVLHHPHADSITGVTENFEIAHHPTTYTHKQQMHLDTVESGLVSAPPEPGASSKVKRLKVFAGVLNAMIATAGGLLLGASYLLTDSTHFLVWKMSIVCFSSVLNFIAYFLLVRLLFRVTRAKKSASQVKKTILSITMTRIIDYELQQQFLVDRVTNVVNELDVRRRLVAFCRSADFESFIVQQLSELKNLDLLVGGDVLDDREALVASLRDTCLRQGSRIVPAAVALFVNDAFMSSTRFHDEVRAWVRRQLDELPSSVISNKLYTVLETKRIEFALSGNIAGAVFAMIIFFTARLHLT